MDEIYALRDPRDGEIRYIGKARCAVARLKTHIYDSATRKTPVYSWFRKLARLGLVPTVEVLMTTENWKEDERSLIALSRERGDRLLNVADGGDEPYCSLETRKANGRKVAEKINADPVAKRLKENKRRLTEALRQGWLPNSARVKMRLAAKIRPDKFGNWLNIPDKVENATV